MLNIKIKAKVVFQRQKLILRQEKQEAGTLMRIGGFYRKVVQRSMRNGNLKKGSKASEPGQPPRYHTKALRQNILFLYDKKKHTVSIYARKLNGTVSLSNVPGPQLLEQGGPARVTTGRGKKRTKKTIRVRARPFVGDASINWPRVVKRLADDRSKLGL